MITPNKLTQKEFSKRYKGNDKKKRASEEKISRLRVKISCLRKKTDVLISPYVRCEAIVSKAYWEKSVPPSIKKKVKLIEKNEEELWEKISREEIKLYDIREKTKVLRRQNVNYFYKTVLFKNLFKN